MATKVDTGPSRRPHHHHHSSSTANTTTNTSRSQSVRVKNNGAVPSSSPSRHTSHHYRSSSRYASDGAPHESTLPPSYESAHASGRNSSRDRPPPSRAESAKSASGHRRHSSRHSADMTTAVANGGGPAPVVIPQHESRPSGKPSKSRTTIPAATGNWVLGKTIGAGSMGKVKLARRVEGGEQVSF